jgi:hypothetical protein
VPPGVDGGGLGRGWAGAQVLPTASARAIRNDIRPGRRCLDIARLQIDEGNLSKCSPSRKRQRGVATFVQPPASPPRWSIQFADIRLIEARVGQIAHSWEGANSSFANSSA